MKIKSLIVTGIVSLLLGTTASAISAQLVVDDMSGTSGQNSMSGSGMSGTNSMGGNAMSGSGMSGTTNSMSGAGMSGMSPNDDNADTGTGDNDY